MKQETKTPVDLFTPGEWKISGTTKSLNGLYIRTDKQTIGQVFSSSPQCEANARLLVESKNMYEALKHLMRDFKEKCRSSKLQDDEETWDSYTDAKNIINRINNKS